MKKILLLSFVRTIFLYIAVFLLYLFSWLIFDYAFPISWKAEIAMFVAICFIQLIGALWKREWRKKQSQ